MCLHPHIDLAVVCGVDNLHTLYFGVTLLLLTPCFTKDHKLEDYSLYKQVHNSVYHPQPPFIEAL